MPFGSMDCDWCSWFTLSMDDYIMHRSTHTTELGGSSIIIIIAPEMPDAKYAASSMYTQS